MYGKINLTSVNSETRAVIKKQVIFMLTKGKKHIDIAETLGIFKYAVDRISSAYNREGSKCLNEKTHGHKLSENVSYRLNRKRKSKAY